MKKKNKFTPLTQAEIVWQTNEKNKNLPYHKTFCDIYFSQDDPYQESLHTFLENENLATRIETSPEDSFTIVETGFGFGLNFCALQELLERKKIQKEIHYYSCEKFPPAKDDVKKFSSQFEFLEKSYTGLCASYPPVVEGWYDIFFAPNIRLHLFWGEVENFVCSFSAPNIDFIFLDGHAPAKNPQMWEKNILQILGQKTKIGATLKSFTVAGEVRRNLQAAGFEVKKITGSAKKRENLFAVKKNSPQENNPNLCLPPWYALPRTTQDKTKKKSVAIVGAGISGCALAWQLCNAGYEVTLIEQHESFAAEGSGNPVGIAHPSPAATPTPLALFSLYAYHAWLQMADEILRNKISFDFSLLPMRFANDGDKIFFKKWLGFQKWSYNFFSIKIHPEFAIMENCLWVSPPELCRALLESAEKTGKLNVLFSTRVKEFKKNSLCQWQLTLQEGKKKFSAEQEKKFSHSDILILAAGATLPQWFLDDYLRLSGGHVIYRQEHNSHKPLPFLYNANHYLISHVQTARIKNPISLAGASYTALLKPHDAPQDFLLSLNQSLKSVQEKDFADMEKKNFMQRFSLRCHSQDYLPIIGSMPDFSFYQENYCDLNKGRDSSCYAEARYHENLFVLGGMGSRGMLWAGLGAKILKQIIARENISLTPYLYEHIHPARFWIRAWQKQKNSTNKY